MRSLYYYFQMARFQHVLMGSLTALVVVTLSAGSDTAKVFSPLAVALQIMGASLYYFAVANKMYILKNQHYALSKGRVLVTGLVGLASMLAGVLISIFWLNKSCVYITVFNTLAIVFYKDIISKWWLSKNIVMGVVCTSPVIIAWWAGMDTHPSVPWGTAVVFFVYLAREIVKDIQDVDVDRGLRKTLALQCDVGVARVVAGTLILAGLSCLLKMLVTIPVGQYHLLIPLLLSVFHFTRVMLRLLFARAIDASNLSKQILLGSTWLIVTFALMLL